MLPQKKQRRFHRLRSWFDSHSDALIKGLFAVLAAIAGALVASYIQRPRAEIELTPQQEFLIENHLDIVWPHQSEQFNPAPPLPAGVPLSFCNRARITCTLTVNDVPVQTKALGPGDCSRFKINSAGEATLACRELGADGPTQSVSIIEPDSEVMIVPSDREPSPKATDSRPLPQPTTPIPSITEPWATNTVTARTPDSPMPTTPSLTPSGPSSTPTPSSTVTPVQDKPTNIPKPRDKPTPTDMPPAVPTLREP